MKIAKIFDVNVKKDIDHLMTDSRIPLKRGMFFCTEGMSFDGHDFIDEAIANGAICIVHSKPVEEHQKGITYIKVNDVQLALNRAIEIFYNDCFKKMRLIGIIGTDGKRAVACWLKDILDKFDGCGYLGGLGVRFKDQQLDESFTKPIPTKIAEHLHDMYKAKIKTCAMELSAPILEFESVDFLDFTIAIFTNFQAEHQELLGTLSNYPPAAKRLFDHLGPDKAAIVNVDDPASIDLIKTTKAKVISYGITKHADYRATNINLKANGTSFTLIIHEKRIPMETKVLGYINIYSILSVIAALDNLKIPLETILSEVARLRPVPGRMENIVFDQNYNVIVDNAGSPDDIDQVLDFVSMATKPGKRVITVLGAAGQRDSGKRPLIGQIADKYSDLIILTEEDQRNDDPQEIAAQIARGIENTEHYYVEDRECAIETALAVAQEGDTVIILGKGEQQFMDRGLGKMMYNYKGDAQVVENYLRTSVR